MIFDRYDIAEAYDQKMNEKLALARFNDGFGRIFPDENKKPSNSKDKKK